MLTLPHTAPSCVPMSDGAEASAPPPRDEADHTPSRPSAQQRPSRLGLTFQNSRRVLGPLRGRGAAIARVVPCPPTHATTHATPPGVQAGGGLYGLHLGEEPRAHPAAALHAAGRLGGGHAQDALAGGLRLPSVSAPHGGGGRASAAGGPMRRQTSAAVCLAAGGPGRSPLASPRALTGPRPPCAGTSAA